MPYSINQMIVDSSNTVVGLQWTYSNADGSLGGEHKLLEPHGNTPLIDVTEEVAIGWLEEQLQNTPEEFDAHLAKNKEHAEYVETLVPYEVHSGSAPSRVVPEEPGQEPVPDQQQQLKAKAKK